MSNVNALKFLLYVKNNDEVLAQLKEGDTTPIDDASDLDGATKESLKNAEWDSLEIDIDDTDIDDFKKFGQIGNEVRAAAFVKTRLEEFFA